MEKPNKYFVTICSILVIAILWLSGKPKDLQGDLWRFKMFVECGANLDKYIDKEMHLGISSIKSLVSANDTVYRLETANTGHYLDYKFYLYPVRLLDVPVDACSNKSPLLVNSVDLETHAEFLSDYNEQYAVDDGHVLFSISPLVAVENSGTSIIKSILLFVLVNLLLLVVGYLIVLNTEIGSFLKLLLAPLVGYTILNVVSMILLLLTGELAAFTTVGLLVLGCAGLVAFNRSLVTSELTKLKQGFLSMFKLEALQNLGSSSRLMLLLTVLSFGICLLHILFRPIWAGDGLAFWMMKADIIFNVGLDFSWGLQNEYPIFWSQFFSVFYGLNGSINHVLAKWYIIIELLLVYGFIWQFTKGLNSRTRVFFAFIFFPVFGYHWLYSLFAETIVILFFFGFARITMEYLKGNMKLKNYLLLGSIFMVGVGYTKLEGVFQILMILLPFLVIYRRVKSKAFIYFSGLAILIVLSLMAWKGFIVDSGWNVSEHAAETPSIAKVFLIVDKLFSILGSMSFFTVALVGVFVQFILVRIPSRTSQALLLSIILTWLFSGVSLIGWETQRIVESAWTAMPRLIWHATPLIIFLSIQLIKDSHIHNNLET